MSTIEFYESRIKHYECVLKDAYRDDRRDLIAEYQPKLWGALRARKEAINKQQIWSDALNNK